MLVGSLPSELYVFEIGKIERRNVKEASFLLAFLKSFFVAIYNLDKQLNLIPV